MKTLDQLKREYEEARAQLDNCVMQYYKEIKIKLNSIGFDIGEPVRIDGQVKRATERKRRRFSTEAKREALRMYREGYTANQAMTKTGIPKNTIYKLHNIDAYPDIINLRNP